MKIRCLSDLHLEFTGYEIDYLTPAGEDLVVLAGDIGIGVAGLDWARRAIPDRPVVYVLGNHEYYKHDFDTLLADARQRVAGSNVHLLENDALDLGGLRILGCTLWTDFRALGEARREPAMKLATRLLNDYAVIDRGARRLSVEDTERSCLRSVQWLAAAIAASDRPVLVVSHHPPTLATQSPFFANTLGSAIFHNDFDALIAPPVRAWIHGHTHYSVERYINGVPVLSNQRGYPREALQAFRWDHLLEVEV